MTWKGFGIAFFIDQSKHQDSVRGVVMAMLRLSGYAGASVFLGLLLANAAQASVVEFTSRAAWNAAVPSSTTIPFNGGSSFTGGGTSLTAGGVNFSVAGGNIYEISPSYYGASFGAGGFYSSSYLNWDYFTPDVMTAILPSLHTAIGFDYAELAGRADTFTIGVGGQTFNVDTNTSKALFFGVTSTTPFSSFTIEDLQAPGSRSINQGPYPTIDNLSLSSISTAPEPSTWAMLLIGFAGIGFMAYRRKSKPALMAA
jgi:hypothetical protein